MIVGIGIDIEHIQRFSLKNASVLFLKRIFTPEEIQQAKQSKSPTLIFSEKFVVKEAFMKAIGQGIHQEVWFTQIEVHHQSIQQTTLKLHRQAKAHYDQLGRPKIHISLSHTSKITLGLVILEI